MKTITGFDGGGEAILLTSPIKFTNLVNLNFYYGPYGWKDDDGTIHRYFVYKKGRTSYRYPSVDNKNIRPSGMSEEECFEDDGEGNLIYKNSVAYGYALACIYLGKASDASVGTTFGVADNDDNIIEYIFDGIDNEEVPSAHIKLDKEEIVEETKNAVQTIIPKAVDEHGDPVTNLNDFVSSQLLDYAKTSEVFDGNEFRISKIPSAIARTETLGQYAKTSEITDFVKNEKLSEYTPKIDLFEDGKIRLDKIPSTIVRDTDIFSGNEIIASKLPQIPDNKMPSGYVKNEALANYAQTSELTKFAEKNDLFEDNKIKISKIPQLTDTQMPQGYTKTSEIEGYVSSAIQHDGTIQTAAIQAANEAVQTALDDSERMTDIVDGVVSGRYLSKEDYADNDGKLKIAKIPSDFAKTSDLKVYAKTSSLVDFAKTSDLKDYTKTTELAKYAEKNDLFDGDKIKLAKIPTLNDDVMPGGYVKTSNLTAYTKTSELESKVMAIDGIVKTYALTSLANADLSNINTDNFNIKVKAIQGMAKTSDLTNFIKNDDLFEGNKIKVAKIPQLTDIQMPTGYVKTDDLEEYATTSDLKIYAKSSSLNEYTKTSSLKDYAQTSSLKYYATTSALSTYAKSDFSNVSNFDNKVLSVNGIAKSEDLNKYAKTSELINFAQTSELTKFAEKNDLFEGNQIKLTKIPQLTDSKMPLGYTKTSEIAGYVSSAIQHDGTIQTAAIQAANEAVQTALDDSQRMTDIVDGVVSGRYLSKEDYADTSGKLKIAKLPTLTDEVMPSGYVKTDRLVEYSKTSEIFDSNNLIKVNKIPTLTDSQIPIGYVKTDKLNEYTKTSSLVNFTKTSDLLQYAKTSTLVDYTPLTELNKYTKTSDLFEGSLIKTSKLPTIPVENIPMEFAKTSSLTQYTKTSELASKVLAIDGLAKTSQLVSYQTTANLKTAVEGIDTIAKTSALKAYQTTSELNNKLLAYQTTANLKTAVEGIDTIAKTSALKAYQTTSELNNKLLAYQTTADLTTKLGAYQTTANLKTAVEGIDTIAKTSALKAYQTTSELNNKLLAYQTTANLKTAVEGIDTIAKTSALKAYQTTSGLETKLGAYQTTANLKSAVENIDTIAKTSALKAYQTTSELNNKLLAYQTTANLKTAVEGIDTIAKTSALKAYQTTSELSNKLLAYQTTSELTSKLAAYQTTANMDKYAKTSVLKDYATTSALHTIDNKFVNYQTTSGLETKLGAYQTTASMKDYTKTSALSAYQTTSGLNTKLAAYQTTANLKTAVEGIDTIAKTSALSAYQTTSGLNTKLKDYATTSALSTIDSKFANYQTTSAMNKYQTTADLSTKLTGYATTGALSNVDNKFVNYQTTAGLDSKLAGYTTTSGLETKLGAYQTTASMKDYTKTSALSAYQTTAGLDTKLTAYQTTANMNKYQTTADLNTKLTGYATTGALNTVDNKFASYQTTSGLETKLGAYQTTANMKNYAQTSSLKDYATTRALSTVDSKFAGYATTGSLNNVDAKFANYQTTAGMSGYQTTAGMNKYQTTADLSTKLTGYATTGALNTVDKKFAGYQTTAGLDTKLAGYATTSSLNNVDAKFSGYATTGALNTVDNKFAGYQTTAGMNKYQTIANMGAYQTTSGMSSYQTKSGMSAYQTTAGMSNYATMDALETVVNDGTATANAILADTENQIQNSDGSLEILTTIFDECYIPEVAVKSLYAGEVSYGYCVLSDRYSNAYNANKLKDEDEDTIKSIIQNVDTELQTQGPYENVKYVYLITNNDLIQNVVEYKPIAIADVVKFNSDKTKYWYYDESSGKYIQCDGTTTFDVSVQYYTSNVDEYLGAFDCWWFDRTAENEDGAHKLQFSKFITTSNYDETGVPYNASAFKTDYYGNANGNMNSSDKFKDTYYHCVVSNDILVSSNVSDSQLKMYSTAYKVKMVTDFNDGSNYVPLLTGDTTGDGIGDINPSICNIYDVRTNTVADSIDPTGNTNYYFVVNDDYNANIYNGRAKNNIESTINWYNDNGCNYENYIYLFCYKDGPILDTHSNTVTAYGYFFRAVAYIAEEGICQPLNWRPVIPYSSEGHSFDYPAVVDLSGNSTTIGLPAGETVEFSPSMSTDDRVNALLYKQITRQISETTQQYIPGSEEIITIELDDKNLDYDTVLSQDGGLLASVDYIDSNRYDKAKTMVAKLDLTSAAFATGIIRFTSEYMQAIAAVAVCMGCAIMDNGLSDIYKKMVDYTQLDPSIVTENCRSYQDICDHFGFNDSQTNLIIRIAASILRKMPRAIGLFLIGKHATFVDPKMSIRTLLKFIFYIEKVQNIEETVTNFLAEMARTITDSLITDVLNNVGYKGYTAPLNQTISAKYRGKFKPAVPASYTTITTTRDVPEVVTRTIANQYFSNKSYTYTLNGTTYTSYVSDWFNNNTIVRFLVKNNVTRKVYEYRKWNKYTQTWSDLGVEEYVDYEGSAANTHIPTPTDSEQIERINNRALYNTSMEIVDLRNTVAQDVSNVNGNISMLVEQINQLTAIVNSITGVSASERIKALTIANNSLAISSENGPVVSGMSSAYGTPPSSITATSESVTINTNTKTIDRNEVKYKKSYAMISVKS